MNVTIPDATEVGNGNSHDMALAVAKGDLFSPCDLEEFNGLEVWKVGRCPDDVMYV